LQVVITFEDISKYKYFQLDLKKIKMVFVPFGDATQSGLSEKVLAQPVVFGVSKLVVLHVFAWLST
jgi:hypothetical protein